MKPFARRMKQFNSDRRLSTLLGSIDNNQNCDASGAVTSINSSNLDAFDQIKVSNRNKKSVDYG